MKIEAKDYGTLVTAALERLQSGLHLTTDEVQVERSFCEGYLHLKLSCHQVVTETTEL